MSRTICHGYKDTK